MSGLAIEALQTLASIAVFVVVISSIGSCAGRSTGWW